MVNAQPTPFFDRFARAVEGALRGTSIAVVCRAAGIKRSLFNNVRQGRAPNLRTAEQIADAVGLELCVRRKGEVLDPMALRLAVRNLLDDLDVTRGRSEAEAEALSQSAADAIFREYAHFSIFFDPSLNEDRDALYAAARTYRRHRGSGRSGFPSDTEIKAGRLEYLKVMDDIRRMMEERGPSLTAPRPDLPTLLLIAVRSCANLDPDGATDKAIWPLVANLYQDIGMQRIHMELEALASDGLVTLERSYFLPWRVQPTQAGLDRVREAFDTPSPTAD